MKIKAYIGSHAAQIETAHDYNFCLTGCLDEAKERPDAETITAVSQFQLFKKGSPTKEQVDAVNLYTAQRARGRYVRKVIDWFFTEEEASAARINWPDYVQFRIQPVEVKIP